MSFYRHHQLQASGEGRLSELQARLQVAQFERERVAMSTEEITQQLSTVQLEKEKLQKKVYIVIYSTLRVKFFLFFITLLIIWLKMCKIEHCC